MLHGRQNLPFCGNLAEKLVVSTIKLFCFATHIHKLFFGICLKSVSQRDTGVSSQKRPKSVLDTDNPYQVACLRSNESNDVKGLTFWQTM